MLVAFDLDDTLADTSGTITPHKLEEALRAMIGAGLVVADFQKGLKDLYHIDARSPSARIAIETFVRDYGGDEKHIAVGVEVNYGPIAPHIQISSVDGATELLRTLSLEHDLVLVTVGKADLQMDKLNRAGIDSSIFSKIVVSAEGEKGIHYRAIMDELGYHPGQVVVCGDRIPNDLTPAKALGCRTVHMRWGRGKTSLGEADYSISHLRELHGIIKQLATEGQTC